MDNNQKGFASATLALLGFTVIVGVWFFWNHSLTDIQNGVNDLDLPKGNKEQILKPAVVPQTESETGIGKFEIVPSQAEKNDSGAAIIRYSAGAKAVVYANNAAKIEFRQRGGGTGVYVEPEGGLAGTAQKIADDGNQTKWEMTLPKQRSYTELCALAFDGQGKKINESCLNNVISQD